MKNNLKSFPTPDVEMETEESINRMYIAWKVAFEKELRERIQWLEDKSGDTPPCSELRVYEIKQILGDS